MHQNTNYSYSPASEGGAWAASAWHYGRRAGRGHEATEIADQRLAVEFMLLIRAAFTAASATARTAAVSVIEGFDDQATQLEEGYADLLRDRLAAYQSDMTADCPALHEQAGQTFATLTGEHGLATWAAEEFADAAITFAAAMPSWSTHA